MRIQGLNLKLFTHIVVRLGHESDIRIFEGICDLFRMPHISNFPICFDSEKYGYSEKRISEK